MERIKIYRTIRKLKNVELFYLDTRTEGPVILCLHGLWGRGETWYDFIQHYGKHYRIIAPDQRGHGLSSKPVSKYTGEELAGDIAELVESLNIASVIITGHSMGGRTAGFFAANYPRYAKAAAILDMPASGPGPNPLPLDRIPIVDPYIKDWPLPFSSLQEATDYIKGATESDLEYRYFMNSLSETVDGYHMLFSTQAMAAYKAYYEDWYSVLPGIQCPVLLVRSGSHKSVSDKDYKKMQAGIPNSIAFEMSHPDHNVHLGNKEEFYGYFDEFLNRIS